MYLGRCELKHLRIFANPGEYKLKFLVENYNNDIKINFYDIKVEVNGCSDNQIEMHDKNILYCENPICKASCPIDTTATCVRYYEKDINDINLNRCECIAGWNGNYCDSRVFMDFR